MNNLLHDAATRAARYLGTLDDRPVAPSPEAIARLGALGGPLPATPSDPAAVLALLDEIASPATVASAGRRYFGFVTGGALPAALAANWLASAWDQNTALRVMSPAGAALEEIAGRWIVELLGLPHEATAGFVTGATMANLAGLAAARHALLSRQGWDVEAQGLFSAPPLTVVVGDEVHVSLLKALALLGLGRERVVRVPVDGQGRMRAEALPPLDGATIVCAQAGNVNTGAVDPLEQICDAAQAAGAWVHVDGAFGLWAAATPSRARLLHGVERADSWATDAHKWLNVPYDSGVVVCRHPEQLRAAMSSTAAYLVSGGPEPSHHSPEMSRRARGVETWAALRSLGSSGVAELVERTCALASRFAEGLRAAGFEVLNEVVLNQVLVSFGDDETTRRAIAALQAEGTCWCGGTVWQGRAAMRISVSSWATTEEDVDRSVAAMVRVLGGVCAWAERPAECSANPRAEFVAAHRRAPLLLGDRREQRAQLCPRAGELLFNLGERPPAAARRLSRVEDIRATGRAIAHLLAGAETLQYADRAPLPRRHMAEQILGRPVLNHAPLSHRHLVQPRNRLVELVPTRLQHCAEVFHVHRHYPPSCNRRRFAPIIPLPQGGPGRGRPFLELALYKEQSMRRYGQLIGVKPEQIEAYERIHAAVWPEVLAMIHTCNIRNYSIFRHGTLLFAYFEYIGEDFAADMARMAADPKTREWWTHTDPMQEPVPERAPGEWWAAMKEVFHTD